MKKSPIIFKETPDTCPNGHTLEKKNNQFYYRGKYYPGLVCKTCNSLWAVKGNNIWEDNQAGKK